MTITGATAIPADLGNTTHPPAEGESRPLLASMTDHTDPQWLARITGVLFLVTFATSIPAFFVYYAPVLHDAGYITSGGAGDFGVRFGALLEMLLIVANVGTAVALFPVLKRVNEVLALGFLTARLVESALIAIGLLSLLAVVSLRQEAAGTDAAWLVPLGQALVALHDWTFLLGPGWVVGVGNGLILGYLMYRSRLIPRPMAILGLIGGPLIIVSGTAILLGVIEAGSAWQAIATIPEFFWELSLGLWLMIKGFNPTALAAVSANLDKDAEQPAPVPSKG